MSQDVLLFIILFVAGIGLIILFLNKRLQELSEKQKPSDELVEWLKSTNQRLEDQSKTFHQTLQANTRSLNERLDAAARVIAGVQKGVGEMSEIGRNMRELSEFLRSPKLRGNIGEQVLKELLGQMLPKQSFSLQYSFRSGATVDAAIKTGNGIIPVDAKFPMENFRKMAGAQTDAEKKTYEKEFIRDLKGHIDAISSKYILDEEGTYPFALMYLPSEAVYYEVVNNADIFDYAAKKAVMPVSPSTFYAYLKAILMSLEGQKIEQRAKEILAAIRAIQKDYNKVEDNLTTLGRHVTNSYNMMSQVVGSFTQLGQKISSTQALGRETKEASSPVSGSESLKTQGEGLPPGQSPSMGGAKARGEVKQLDMPS